MSNPSKRYWENRFIQLNEALFKKGEGYTAVLNREYKKAMAEIEKEIDIWLRRLADNNDVSLAEAKRLLKGKELQEFKWTVQDYIRYGKENRIDQRWLKELENASARVHISRYESLLIQVRQRVEELAVKKDTGMKGLARELLTEGYYHTIYEVQTGFSSGAAFTKLNERVLELIISKPWTADGKNFSNRIWDNKQRLLAELHTNLTQAIIRGDAPDEAIRNISKKFDVSRKQAGRLVMTESAYFAAEGQKKAYQELEIEKYEIVATLDSHTSDICEELDGKILDMKDYAPGQTAPPFHPWCRTVTAPYFEDNYTERVARDADGKVYYVDGKMKYKEWKKMFVA